jgi:polyferredoxin
MEASHSGQRNLHRRNTIEEMLLEKTSRGGSSIWGIRKIVQIASTVTLIGASFGVTRTVVTLPILLTLGNSDKTVVAALDAIQEMSAEAIIPWIPLAVFILFGVFVGRATCAWICPFGLLQDLIGLVNGKRREVSLRTHSGAVKIKYMILGMTLFVSGSLVLSLIYKIGADYKAALGVLAHGPFSALSPEATFLGVLPVAARMILLHFLGIPPTSNPMSLDLIWSRLSSMTSLLAIRLMILIFVMILSFFVLRAWCRYFCPAGALLAIFGRFSFLGLRRNLLQCNKCGDCMKVCPMLVRITERPWEKMTDPECIMCLECTGACAHNAIKPTFP